MDDFEKNLSKMLTESWSTFVTQPLERQRQKIGDRIYRENIVKRAINTLMIGIAFGTLYATYVEMNKIAEDVRHEQERRIQKYIHR